LALGIGQIDNIHRCNTVWLFIAELILQPIKDAWHRSLLEVLSRQ
jgi:hypothetical protein